MSESDSVTFLIDSFSLVLKQKCPDETYTTQLVVLFCSIAVRFRNIPCPCGMKVTAFHFLSGPFHFKELICLGNGILERISYVSLGVGLRSMGLWGNVRVGGV